MRRTITSAIVSSLLALAVAPLGACGGGGGGGEGPLWDAGPSGFDIGSRPDFGGIRPDGGDPDVGLPDDVPDAEDIQERDLVAHEVTVPDTGPQCLGFQEPCEFNGDCCAGWCVIGPDGFQRVCSQTCITECPEDWGCTQVGSYPDIAFICIPRRPPSCHQPCVDHADCTADHRCLAIGHGHFCSRSCAGSDGVPNDAVCESPDGEEYTCAEGFDSGGESVGFYCQPVSDSCVCGPEIDLDNDPNNCGDCGRACAFDNAEPLCIRGECAKGPCDDGWVDLNGVESDGCEYECTFQSAEDLPDPYGEDANCDGVDGVLARSVFVAPSGDDMGNRDGTMDRPFRTLAAAMAFTSSVEGLSDVLVSAGAYEEQLNVVSGVNLYGGYNRSEGWVRSIRDNPTHIVWNSVESGAIRAVVVLGASEPTTVDGFEVRAGTNPLPGGSSYGVYITHVGEDFVLSNCTVTAGDGGNGIDGVDGEPGQDGASGSPGEVGKSDYCNDDFPVVGGPAGVRWCGVWNASGGNGGDAGYGKEDGWFCDGDPNGDPGQTAAGGASGGAGGTYSENGGDGSDGSTGVAGAAGAAGRSDGTHDAFGLWQPVPGGDGEDGSHGDGGGGGGGGGGEEDQVIIIETGTYHGGSGAGGGAGGCGGTAGTGGGSGGGSFGIFVFQATPTLLDNHIEHGQGGSGGEGGSGGRGGRAGSGGLGGAGVSGSGDGGDGGDGGAGGDGGHGGGGAGGPAWGLYLAAQGNPVCDGNTFMSGGTGGIGGVGGDPFDTTLSGERGPHGDINAPTARCAAP